MNDSDEHLLNFPQENLSSRRTWSLNQNACRWPFLSRKHLETVSVPSKEAPCVRVWLAQEGGKETMQMSAYVLVQEQGEHLKG